MQQGQHAEMLAFILPMKHGVEHKRNTRFSSACFMHHAPCLGHVAPGYQPRPANAVLTSLDIAAASSAIYVQMQTLAANPGVKFSTEFTGADASCGILCGLSDYYLLMLRDHA